MLRIRSTGWLFGLGAALLLAPAPAAHAQTTLKFQFRPGSVQKQSIVTSMESEATVGKTPVKSSMTQTMDVSLKVNEVGSDGKAALAQSVDRIRVDMEMPAPINKKIHYDSKEPAGDQDKVAETLSKSMGGLVGAEFTMKMDPQGNASDFTVPQKFLDSLKGSPGAAVMGDAFSEEGLKQMMTQSNFTFPTKPLRKGESWEKAVKIKLPIGTMTNQMTYTYEGPTRSGLEMIAVKAQMSLDPAARSPFKMTIKDSEGTGQILFDNRAGKVAENTLDQTLNVETEVNKQTIAQKIVVHTKVSDRTGTDE